MAKIETAYVPTNYYQDWSENDLRNALWSLSMGMSIKGPYQDERHIRIELARRGLSTKGYHEDDDAE